MNDEYLKVEEPALEQLKAMGYLYLHGEALTPAPADARQGSLIPSEERSSLRDVVLVPRLEKALKRINPWINEQNLRKVAHDLLFPRAASQIEANELIHEMLVNYVSVEQDLGKGKKGQTVKVVDFDHPERNEFLAVNQFRVQGPQQNIVPDIVIFVNGLPLAVIECKAPYITNPMEAGINQLLRYANLRQSEEQEGAERLFNYNQIMVATHGDMATMGTISSGYQNYMEWKDPHPAKLDELPAGRRSQEILLAGMFRKDNLLDIVRNFVVFEPVNGRVVKKMARYQQYRAVHQALKRLKTGTTRKERGGVIWHTQGSGKSLTMVFMAVKMRRDPELRDYKLVFVTDRTQLDRQLTGTFERCQGETVKHARNVQHFKELLKKDGSDLVTGMLQKFQEKDFEDMQELNPSPKIVVLVDEAHRGLYSTLGTNINIALPNAPKIAFTGTPLIKSRKTVNEFGSYIDTYTIDQSVADGATLQIIYEGRESNTKVTGESLDKLFEIYFGDKSDEERAAIKDRYAREQAVLEAPKRIEMICGDILDHYRKHIQPNGFKAQIVTSSREAAVRYKQALDKLNAPESAVIISGDHNDPPHIRRHTDRAKQREYIRRFKAPMKEDGLSFLIVKDMLLTGFDASVEQVMYLDRRLMDHGLLQAIARVNRTASGKTRGYIVDYYGLADYLKEALAVFGSDDVKGALIPLKEELPKLERRHAAAMKHFEGLDIDDTEECIAVLKDEEIRNQFEIDLRKFLKSMDIIMPRAEAGPYIGDMKRLGEISRAARNRYRTEMYSVADSGAKVRDLIDQHIYSTGVDPKIEPVALLSDKFEEHLDSLKSEKAKASEIEHAIKHHITVNIDKDPEHYRKLSERLEEILRANEERWEQLTAELANFREQIKTARQDQAEEIGLSKDEYAYYGVLESEMKAAGNYVAPGPQMRKSMIELSKRIYDLLRESTYIVDFFDKENEKKRVRREIKRAIMDSGLDLKRKTLNKVRDRFMELARAHFEER